MATVNKTMFKNITYSPLFWIFAVIFSSLCYFFTFHTFSTVFPLIHLNITMDMPEATKKAAHLAKDYNLGPQDYHSAALFFTDTAAKTFVELEAGGRDAVIKMMDQNFYMPYVWTVRHFREYETRELLIRFTPDGTPYGFVETLSENDGGPQLTAEDALHIAVQTTTHDWDCDLAPYTLIEKTTKTQPSGRLDHTFTYERTGEKLGNEGTYRLQLRVSGDRLTELTHCIKVPESFTRHYAQMRSANNTIALVASIILALFYVIVGCGFGLYYLSHRRYIMWKQACLLAVSIGLAMASLAFNQLPSAWMSYYTAYSYTGFFAQITVSSVIMFLIHSTILTMIIAVAEGLTRAAFGNHPQLWSLWSSRNRTSYQLLGRTIGAYLFVGLNCAYVMLFYILSARYLNWWNPSETLFDPNILASYLPWLSPIAQSLYAGVMEECLFRAIPLAGAALLGARYGRKSLWIGVALILQALIFGAVHANYPTQPAYTRIIELFIPSLVWGYMYLRFGLLTTMIMHTVYDIIWFSLPLFASHAPYATLYQSLIVFLGVMPLLIIACSYFKKRQWTMLSEHDTHQSWQPTAPIEKTAQNHSHHNTQQQQQQASLKVIVIIALTSAFVWLWITPFTSNGIRVNTTREQAQDYAHTYLVNHGISLSPSLKTLPLFFNNYALVPGLSLQHIFVWKNGSQKDYKQLLNTYLQPAHWTIRYAQFEGDVTERAEEYKLMLYDATRFYHHLPENRDGAQLTQEQARIIAHDTVRTRYHLDPQTLTEIAAKDKQQPHRKDWLFTFADTQSYPLSSGQARIDILISGNTVTDAARYIHVPEEWIRQEHNDIQQKSIIDLILTLFLIILAVLLYRNAQNSTIESTFSRQTWYLLFCILIIMNVVHLGNTWPTVVGAFNTSEPASNQLLITIMSNILGIFVQATILAYIITRLWGIRYTQPTTNNMRTTLISGMGVGLCYAALSACYQKYTAIYYPLWPDYTPLHATIPVLSALVTYATTYIRATLTVSLISLLITSATRHWNTHTILATIFCILLGLVSLGLPSMQTLLIWLCAGTLLGCIYLVLHRVCVQHNSVIIPIATGTYILTIIIQQGLFNAYPCAQLCTTASAVLVCILATVWVKNVSAQQ